jgi:hypothetical protein
MQLIGTDNGVSLEVPPASDGGTGHASKPTKTPQPARNFYPIAAPHDFPCAAQFNQELSNRRAGGLTDSRLTNVGL